MRPAGWDALAGDHSGERRVALRLASEPTRREEAEQGRGGFVSAGPREREETQEGLRFNANREQQGVAGYHAGEIEGAGTVL